MQAIWKQIAIVLLSLLYFECRGKLKSPSCCVIMTETREGERNNIFLSHRSQVFSNRNRMKHNYAEPICRRDFSTDVPCNRLEPHIPSHAYILMPIIKCSCHMFACLFIFSFAGDLFYIYLPQKEIAFLEQC